jgi:CxxC motif-containing protein (DUF1111 family)
VAACGSHPTSVPVSAPVGDPLPGLSAEELALFEAGRASFNRQFTPEDGLGPRFNENSCEACHTEPMAGGTGETIVTKATRHDVQGRCDLLSSQGGENVRLRVTPQAAALGAERPDPPSEATHEARFIIPFLYGLGIAEAVPQEALDALADPDDRDGDAISGRVGRDGSGRPARFGRKADQATLMDFIEGAFRLEMGVTTATHPSESSAGSIPPVPDGADLAPEPEVDDAELRAVVAFVRMLAPPSPGEARDDAQRAAVEEGRTLFSSLGCGGCHVPTLRAGPSEVSAIEGQTIALYSDLLLHDMGPGLEGTCGPGASTTEWRTEPLMSLRYRRLFLHDGRVGRVIDAVLSHGGEAEAARDRFAALDRLTQESLLRFLDTL